MAAMSCIIPAIVQNYDSRNMKQYKLVVTKSTVPVGTASKVRAVIQEELDKRCV